MHPLPPIIIPSCTQHCTEPGNTGIATDTQRCVEDIRAADSHMYELPLQKKGDRLPFQIFPEPVGVEVEVLLGQREGVLGCVGGGPGKERLPSIVVEPTDVSEVESGELRWPPEPEEQDAEDEEEEEEEEDEDLFLEQCIPPANIADWGEEDEEGEEREVEEEEEEEEESSIIIHNPQNTSLLDLQSGDFRDETPTLSPESTPALN